VIATRAALKLADYVITEAGFGSDLGAEKFFDIKCRKAGLRPDAVVLVATIRALKMHGGVARADLGAENLGALEDGIANLVRHIGIITQFGVPVIVGLNRFLSDTDAEVAMVLAACAGRGVDAVECTHWGEGGAGAEALAHMVAEKAESGEADFNVLYPDDMKLWDKIETIATRIYGAGSISAPDAVRRQIATFEERGYADLPICMAKTQLSLSADPALRGAPEGHEVQVREVRLSAGAGFIVAICGNIMTMPGLPRVPAANNITVNDQGEIEGLF
jgi:formate--tetrahydrofolate ligase